MVKGIILTMKYHIAMGNSFKENLKEELEFQDITIKELSQKTGISKRSIENYLSKRESMPPADYAVKIASVLGLTVEQLVNGNEPTEHDILSIKEKHFLAEFRNLPKNFQEILETMIHLTSKTISTS